jgi:hypothetical protein
MLMRRIQILCDQCNQWIPAGRIDQHEGTGSCYRNRGRGRATRDPGRVSKTAIYAAAEKKYSGYRAMSAVWRSDLDLFAVLMEPVEGRGSAPDIQVMFTAEGHSAGFGKKLGSARDPETIRQNLRRKTANAKRKPLIGRRKTVRMSASGFMSRRTRKGAKRAMFRMNQKAKLLACHACNRTDFASEKSLKHHTEKFHTPGQKSPRGFRTRRDQ